MFSIFRADFDAQESGTYVDLSSYNLPYKIFTYLFRPTLFEGKNLFTILMALENTILLSTVFYQFLITIKNMKLKFIKLNSLKFF